LKFAAFSREEDRVESMQIRQALRLGHYKDHDRLQMQRAANALKRYPMKAWVTMDAGEDTHADDDTH
jgi:hypothetical protein